MERIDRVADEQVEADREQQNRRMRTEQLDQLARHFAVQPSAMAASTSAFGSAPAV